MATLVPALHAQSTPDPATPSHVRELHAPGEVKVQVVDAIPFWLQRPLRRGHLLGNNGPAAQELCGD